MSSYVPGYGTTREPLDKLNPPTFVSAILKLIFVGVFAALTVWLDVAEMDAYATGPAFGNMMLVRVLSVSPVGSVVGSFALS